MTVVSAKTFLEKPIHFFNLARREDIAVKRGKFTFRLTLSTSSNNPSPTGDSYFDVPQNMNDILESSKQAHSGMFAVTLQTAEDINKYLGLD